VGAEARETSLLSKQYPTANHIAGIKNIVHKLQTTKDHSVAKDPNAPHSRRDVAASELARPAILRRKSNLLSAAFCALVIPGLFATVALPAYGATSVESSNSTSAAGAAGQSATGTDAIQSLSVPSPSPVVVSATAASMATKPVEPVMDNGLQRDIVTYVAPRRPALVRWSPELANTKLSGIAGIAARYLGVPYKFGGESPAGFDCSGLVEYVYAKVGIRLPHSAAEQGRLGHRVSIADAVPGDVVVMNGGSHVGIYIGNHKMIDAPYPGRKVSVDKIYDDDYYIVRF
jgi:cell wall-associated NlpC family hydrolase